MEKTHVNVQLSKDGPITQMALSALQRRTGVVDNDVEYTTWVEYCVKGCDGPAHKTGVADSQDHFCDKHVHRSVNMILKDCGLTADLLAATF